MKLRRTVCALLCAVLLFGAADAALAYTPHTEYIVSGKTLDDIFADYLSYRKIPAGQIAVGYYNTATGETWYFNENTYMTAGSMYKVPLAMIYYDGFADGTYQPDDRTDGATLSHLINRAVQYSDNEAADALRFNFSRDQFTYRSALARYSDVAPEDLPSSFLHNNAISPHIILQTLKYLYDNSEKYADIIRYMKDAHRGHYFKKYESEFEIAHKYGAFQDAWNDCGIIYTPQPFLLVVYTWDVDYAERALGELADLMTQYTLAVDRELEENQDIARENGAMLFTYNWHCVCMPDGTAVGDTPFYTDEDSGALMFPLEALAEGAGAALVSDERTGSIVVRGSGSRIRLWMDSPKAEINGAACTLECPTTLVDGRTMVAVTDAFVRALDVQIGYVGYDRVLIY